MEERKIINALILTFTDNYLIILTIFIFITVSVLEGFFEASSPIQIIFSFLNIIILFYIPGYLVSIIIREKSLCNFASRIIMSIFIIVIIGLILSALKLFDPLSARVLFSLCLFLMFFLKIFLDIQN